MFQKQQRKKSHIKGLKEHGSFIIYIYPGFSRDPKKSRLTTINSSESRRPKFTLHEAKGDSENANNATMQMIRFALEERAKGHSGWN